MLKTNLSTRPFYNERAVHALLIAGLLLVIALAVFNVSRVLVVSSRYTDLSSRARAADARSQELRASALAIRRGLDPKELEAVTAAAREANAIIDRRLFSWTELFNRFETTLPDDVRITLIRPRIDRDGVVTVELGIVGRRVEDIEQFMSNLEGTGTFSDVLMREENVAEDGTLVAVLEGQYRPESAPVPLRGAR
jgi:hypothetical protein